MRNIQKSIAIYWSGEIFKVEFVPWEATASDRVIAYEG